MNPTIEKHIPIPPYSVSGRSGKTETMRAMQSGDSVLVPKRELSSWRSMANYHKIKIITRKEGDGETYRLWKR